MSVSAEQNVYAWATVMPLEVLAKCFISEVWTARQRTLAAI